MRKTTERGLASSDIAKIVFAAVAVVFAIAFIAMYMKSQEGYEVGHAELPPGSAQKVQAMKAMKEGNKSSDGKSQTGADSGAGKDMMGAGDSPSGASGAPESTTNSDGTSSRTQDR